MKNKDSFAFFFSLSLLFLSASSDGTILFSSVGRTRYAFHLFALHLSSPLAETQITFGTSLNHNGHFPPPASALSLLPDPSLSPFLHVSERNGSFNIYLDGYDHGGSSRRSVFENRAAQIPLLPENQVGIKDRPSISGDFLIYVSTHEKPSAWRKSWAAVYSTSLKSGETRRLTPLETADFSPAVSPSGEWTAVASYGEKGWSGELIELRTGVYIFKTRDGSQRTRVVDHGGWPCWWDESTIYFHRRSDDGWWSVYRASLSVGVVERVTPPGLHAFTPATAPGSGFIAVATIRPASDFRHIELFDLRSNEFVEISRKISPKTHHYNPFLSSDATRLGYHRCGGKTNTNKKNKHLLLLENIHSPLPETTLFRCSGKFASISPDGNRIAFVRSPDGSESDFTGVPGLYVANRDGSGIRQIIFGTTFFTAWDPKQRGVIYTSHGPAFAPETAGVNIVSVHLDDASSPNSYKRLTLGGGNNAFPFPSPDGKRVVFRSGRSGYMNLYIMDATEGEGAGLVRLTEGNWTDTMCSWSPDGEWITFASDRNRSPGSYALYLIRPDGTGLKKVVESGPHVGLVNHPWFSPDSRRIVFTTDKAAFSSEPIGGPIPYHAEAEIFIANIDGSGITRLTHNQYNDGPPSWSSSSMPAVDVVEAAPVSVSCEFDDYLSAAQSFNSKGRCA